jgi:hypothetical protein
MINELATMKDVFDFINILYPNWILYILDDYSSNYPHLSYNWKFLNEQHNVPSQKIILIDKFENDDHLSFAEVLTKTGCVVRTISEFSPCSVCKKIAVPTLPIHEKIQKAGKDVPKVWSDKCKNCNSECNGDCESCDKNCIFYKDI